MSIVLLILKIIGIILLILFGLLLVLLAAALFVPFRYSVAGEVEEKARLGVKLHWLFYLIYLRFTIVNGEKTAVLRICGIPVYRIPEKRKKQKKSRKTKAELEVTTELQVTEDADAANTEANCIRSSEAMEKDVESSLEVRKKDANAEQDVYSEESDVAQEGGKFAALWARIKEKLQIFKRIKEAIVSLPERIRRFKKKIASIWQMICDKGNQDAVRLILTEIKYILYHCRPRRGHMDIRYSLADPALTGQSLAIISMIPFFYKKEVQIVPDFQSEEFFVLGSLNVKGHVRLIHLLRSGIHIWRDKNIKRCIRRFRQ